MAPSRTPAASLAASAEWSSTTPATGSSSDEEKIAAYPLLGLEVEALDAQSSDLLRGAFLRMDDAKARELEEKIKMQRIAELEQFYRRI